MQILPFIKSWQSSKFVLYRVLESITLKTDKCVYKNQMLNEFQFFKTFYMDQEQEGDYMKTYSWG